MNYEDKLEEPFAEAQRLATGDAHASYDALHLPEVILILDDDFDRLGPKYRVLVALTLADLRDRHGDDLGRMIAEALKVCCFSVLYQAATVARMIELGLIEDTKASRERATPKGAGIDMGFSWLFCFHTKSLGAFKGMEDALECLGLFWLREASICIAMGEVTEALNMLYEAGDALQLAQTSKSWDESTEEAIVEARRPQSKGGFNSAKKMHAKTNELKAWARAEALSMRGSAASIARKLFDKLPDHLKYVVEDPERVIRDMLRLDRKREAQAADSPLQ